MYLNLLHVDDALKRQALFLEQCRGLQARESEAAEAAAGLRLWGKDAAVENFRRHLHSSLHCNGGSGTVVTFMGSGDFHHISALLIGMMAESSDAPLTVIHFDNHPDWVHFSGGLHCGSWVNRALALPQVKRVITIGACSRDLRWPEWKRANLQALRNGKTILLPWRSPSQRFRARDIGGLERDQFLNLLKTLIPTRNVYITIDKDVLSHEGAVTNWDQGQMDVGTLVATLRFVLAHHHAVGIDVTGDYSRPHYPDMLRKLETLIDQPWRQPDADHAANINQKSNLRLLECISEAA